MGWLIAAGVVTLLALLPLGVFVQYDAHGALVRLILGPVKLTLLPQKKKRKKKKSPNRIKSKRNRRSLLPQRHRIRPKRSPRRRKRNPAAS